MIVVNDLESRIFLIQLPTFNKIVSTNGDGKLNKYFILVQRNSKNYQNLRRKQIFFEPKRCLK